MKKISILLFTFLLVACSSAPKRSMQVSTIYSSATEMIESANACILSGDYDKASFFLSAAESQAMSIDNYDLLTAAALARCSLKLSLNPPEVDEAQQYVDYAKKFVKTPKYAHFQIPWLTLTSVLKTGRFQRSLLPIRTLFAYAMITAKEAWK